MRILMTELTELDGVGPARSDYLKEGGYETPSDIAEGDPAEIAEVINAPEDTALELVVQSQNIVEDNEKSSSEESSGTDSEEIDSKQTITQEEQDILEEVEEENAKGSDDQLEDSISEETQSASASEDSSKSDPEKSDAEVEVEEISFSIEFDDPLQYDTLFDSVMQQRSRMYRSNRSGVEAFDHALEQMRNGGIDEPVELDLTKSQLNDLHNCIRQKTIEYKGDNLIDHMDELNKVLTKIDEVRSEHLF